MIRWADGQVSFCITQPHYDGSAASDQEIEQFFENSGWTRIRDPNGEHAIFMNYAFGALATDAMPRNCKCNDDGLQPFDVILCEPDAEIEDFLNLYPD